MGDLSRVKVGNLAKGDTGGVTDTLVGLLGGLLIGAADWVVTLIRGLFIETDDCLIALEDILVTNYY